MAFLHHPCFQQTKKTRDRLILAFCSSLQEAGVQVKNTMETVCVWRAISEQHAHSALELFEISFRVLWSINQFLICFWTKLALTFPRLTNRTMKHPENTIEIDRILMKIRMMLVLRCFEYRVSHPFLSSSLQLGPV